MPRNAKCAHQNLLKLPNAKEIVKRTESQANKLTKSHQNISDTSGDGKKYVLTINFDVSASQLCKHQLKCCDMAINMSYFNYAGKYLQLGIYPANYLLKFNGFQVPAELNSTELN